VNVPKVDDDVRLGRVLWQGDAARASAAAASSILGRASVVIELTPLAESEGAPWHQVHVAKKFAAL